MEPFFLTLEDILYVHREQIACHGGRLGVRDMGLLQSALAQPQSTFEGAWLHRDLQEMAAAYLFHLVQNHPFIDGNKRVGLETALLFLALNGVEIEVEDDDLYGMVLSVAKGACEKPAIARFFRDHAVE